MSSLISSDNDEITHQRSSFTDGVMSHSVKPVVTVEACIMVISCSNGVRGSDGPCRAFVELNLADWVTVFFCFFFP